MILLLQPCTGLADLEMNGWKDKCQSHKILIDNNHVDVTKNCE